MAKRAIKNNFEEYFIKVIPKTADNITMTNKTVFTYINNQETILLTTVNLYEDETLLAELDEFETKEELFNVVMAELKKEAQAVEQKIQKLLEFVEK